MDRIYTFKVEFSKKIYRVIEINGSDSLEDLAFAILKAFNFDADHCFGFYSNKKNIYKSDEVYELFVDMGEETQDNAKGVQETDIDEVFLKGKEMVFLFDYGDEWLFLIKCIDDSGKKVARCKYPRVAEKAGKAPEQYPDF